MEESHLRRAHSHPQESYYILEGKSWIYRKRKKMSYYICVNSSFLRGGFWPTATRDQARPVPPPLCSRPPHRPFHVRTRGDPGVRGAGFAAATCFRGLHHRLLAAACVVDTPALRSCSSVHGTAAGVDIIARCQRGYPCRCVSVSVSALCHMCSMPARIDSLILCMCALVQVAYAGRVCLNNSCWR
jgi:hypothetical protein